MKLLKYVLLPAFVIIGIPRCVPEKPQQEAVKIIFDTDFGPDYDDVGALAFLHAMADSGKAEILATLSCNKHELVGPSMDALNTYFGRPDLPMGAPKGRAVNMTAFQHWPDSIVAKYPHKLEKTSDLPDAVSVYRKILHEQPDSSVTIVTVGFLTNLANLLQSQPDSNSLLTGMDLVSKKVKKLVSMAGKFPEGKEFNVQMDSLASVFVCQNWPTPIVFTGWEIGSQIHTGLRLIASDITNSPVKDVFRISIPMADEDKSGRMSWDETAVLIAVYGTKGFFSSVAGTMTVNADGSNGWVNRVAGNHTYVVQEMPVAQISRFIEERMMHVPVKN
jgi:pyrimidine-specific ribonucleoside hydrolase